MWVFLAVLVLGVVMFIAMRGSGDDYNAGSGMFKNSEFNINEDKKDFSDVEYYNNEKNNKMK
ncbi:MAG: hypothetical protein U0M12_06975 [Acutalibacteraceae bacterium]|nr:hypothetical protein [Acutalibacteraceae bacterium]